MNRLPVCTEETMAAAIDAMRMARRQADQTIMLSESTTDDGDVFYVIRDTLAEPGQRLLWKTPAHDQYAKFIALPVAEQKLQELRDRRVVLAIIATLPQ